MRAVMRSAATQGSSPTTTCPRPTASLPTRPPASATAVRSPARAASTERP